MTWRCVARVVRRGPESRCGMSRAPHRTAVRYRHEHSNVLCHDNALRGMRGPVIDPFSSPGVLWVLQGGVICTVRCHINCMARGVHPTVTLGLKTGPCGVLKLRAWNTGSCYYSATKTGTPAEMSLKFGHCSPATAGVFWG
jgi:hypothetical protein